MYKVHEMRQHKQSKFRGYTSGQYTTALVRTSFHTDERLSRLAYQHHRLKLPEKAAMKVWRNAATIDVSLTTCLAETVPPPAAHPSSDQIGSPRTENRPRSHRDPSPCIHSAPTSGVRGTVVVHECSRRP